MTTPDVSEKPSAPIAATPRTGSATALLNLKTRSMALDLLNVGGFIPKPRLRQAIRIAKRALAQTPNAESSQPAPTI